MVQGVRTVLYRVNDMGKAKAWYTTVLGTPPYFDEPYYIGLKVGGYEFGLIPEDGESSKGAGVIAYWGVENSRAAYDRLLKLGARKQHEVEDVGGGIVHASVYDPLGNIFGVIQNPHFKPEEK